MKTTIKGFEMSMTLKIGDLEEHNLDTNSNETTNGLKDFGFNFGIKLEEMETNATDKEINVMMRTISEAIHDGINAELERSRIKYQQNHGIQSEE
jgi:hypothetical protein